MREHDPKVNDFQIPNKFGVKKFVISHWLKPLARLVSLLVGKIYDGDESSS